MLLQTVCMVWWAMSAHGSVSGTAPSCAVAARAGAFPLLLMPVQQHDGRWCAGPP